MAKIRWHFVLDAPSLSVGEALLYSCDISPTDELLALSDYSDELGIVPLISLSKAITLSLRYAECLEWANVNRPERLTVFADKELTLEGTKANGSGSFLACRVRQEDFIAFATRRGWSLPQELAALASQSQAPLNRAARWPWGTHETNLLRLLADAAKRYWENFDPSDPTTAPTNEDVKQFLNNRGVSTRTAEVMAQILRADGLRPGPRPEKGTKR